MAGNFDLCADLRLIADAIGRQGALRLAGKVLAWDRHGKLMGRRNSVYIPRSADRLARLNDLVTQDEAGRLIAALGGEILNISTPSDPLRRLRDAHILRLAGDGVQLEAIGFLCGVTARQARNVIALHGVPVPLALRRGGRPRKVPEAVSA